MPKLGSHFQTRSDVCEKTWDLNSRHVPHLETPGDAVPRRQAVAWHVRRWKCGSGLFKEILEQKHLNICRIKSLYIYTYIYIWLIQSKSLNIFWFWTILDILWSQFWIIPSALSKQGTPSRRASAMSATDGRPHRYWYGGQGVFLAHLWPI